jgi:hypothetical protein
MLWRCHNLIRKPVGLSFERIAARADAELAL